MKKVIILNSSPRKNFNTAKLLQEAQKGAQSAGAETEYFNLYDYNFSGCRSCFACQRKGSTTNGICAIKDDISKNLTAKLVECDLIVLVTPLYYFGVSAQLKIVIDRFYARTGRISGKKSILIATAWNSDSWTMQALEQYYQTLVQYMRWQNLGAIYATGCGYRDAVERSKFGDQAWKLGKSI